MQSYAQVRLQKSFPLRVTPWTGSTSQWQLMQAHFTGPPAVATSSGMISELYAAATYRETRYDLVQRRLQD